MTTTVTREMIEKGYREEHYSDNLGAGFTLGVGGATEITIQRRGAEPRITWCNTYGNTYSNGGDLPAHMIAEGFDNTPHYAFDAGGRAVANAILNSIEKREAKR